MVQNQDVQNINYMFKCEEKSTQTYTYSIFIDNIHQQMLKKNFKNKMVRYNFKSKFMKNNKFKGNYTKKKKNLYSAVTDEGCF